MSPIHQCLAQQWQRSNFRWYFEIWLFLIYHKSCWWLILRECANFASNGTLSKWFWGLLHASMDLTDCCTKAQLTVLTYLLYLLILVKHHILYRIYSKIIYCIINGCSLNLLLAGNRTGSEALLYWTGFQHSLWDEQGVMLQHWRDLYVIGFVWHLQCITVGVHWLL